MRMFQVSNNMVVIVKEALFYNDTIENYILDGGVIEKDGKKLILAVHDSQQNYCEVNGEVLEYPVEFFDNIIDNIENLLANKEKREYVAPTLDELKAQKLTELKTIRDTEEVKPISYQGNHYDYDSKARDRINAAIIALDVSKGQIAWTTADNTEVMVNADDLRGVIAAVAMRSNKLHNAYRIAKEKVLEATTKEEVEKVVLNNG